MFTFLKKFKATRENPYFSGSEHPETFTFDISGNKLSIDLPPHNDVTFSVYEPNCSMGAMPPNADERGITPFNQHMRGHPSVEVLLKLGYTIHDGGWRMPNIGYLKANIYLRQLKTMPAEMSCFNPQHAEQALKYIAYYNFGPGNMAERKHMGITDWQIKQINGLTWQRYFCAEDIRGHTTRIDINELVRGKNFKEIYTLPIGDNYMLEVCFDCHGYWPALQCHKAVNAYTAQLMQTVKLTYSAEANAQKIQAQEKWPNAKHSEQLPREEWVYHLKDGEDPDDRKAFIDLPGTPPPVFQP